MAFGTLSTLDTLRSTQQTIAEYGEDRAFEDFQNLLDAHNAQVAEMFGNLVEQTDDRQRRYGAGGTILPEEMDEHGSPHPQKVAAGSTVGFPLRSYKTSVQWTRQYFQEASVSELAGQFTAQMDGDKQRLINEVKRAIFTPTNYAWADYLVDHLQQIQLAVKALINADSAEIPTGPNGETFDGSTHTHYLGTGSFVNADLVSLLETVLEHYAGGDAVININRAQEATIRGFADFTPYLDARLVGATSATEVRTGTLDPTRIYNRAIGLFRGAEVWVKPWMPASYVFCYLRGQNKPLVYRTRRAADPGWSLVFDDERHPLRARGFERKFGIGVWERTNGAVLYTANATYSAPTIA
jgi:hypothetical protein